MLFAGCSSDSGAPVAAKGAEQDLIVGVVQDFFQALEARERVRLERVLHEDAQLTRIDTRGDTVAVSTSAGSDWILSVSEPGPPLIERMDDVHVQFAGGLANVWAHYTFHIGEELSHCGHDAFQLVKSGSGDWRILGVTYTIETCR
jgi:hypothetical protein